jgi:hypothetical protein
VQGKEILRLLLLLLLLLSKTSVCGTIDGGRECRGEKDEGSECGYVGKGIGEKQSISFWLWFETPDDDDGGGELKKRRKEKVERET